MKKKTIGILTVILVSAIAMIGIVANRNHNIIYAFDGEKYDREAYYDQMREHYGNNFIYQYLEKEYLTGLEVDETIKSSIASQEAMLLEQNSSAEDKNMIALTLRSMGYNGLEELNLFLTNQYHKSNILQEHVLNVFEDFNEFEAEMQPRIVTHVLVQAQRDSNEHMESDVPLDMERKLMNEVDSTLSKSDNITKSMIDLTSDEGIIGESLGYMDNNSQLVDSFIKGAQNLKEGDISEWIKSEFGYHRIFIESTDIDKIKEYPEFKESVFNFAPSLEKEIMFDVMQADDVEVSEQLLNDNQELKGTLFTINKKSYTQEDVLEEILKLDYGQFLIRDLEQKMLNVIKEEKNYDVSKELNNEVENFKNAGLDFEMMLGYYGFTDEAHLRENLESALILDKFAKEMLEKQFYDVYQDYGLKKLHVFQVESEAVAREIELYVKNDYEVDLIKDEFEVTDNLDLVYYKGMNDIPEDIISDLNEHDVAVDAQDNYALVFVFSDEEIPTEEAEDVILNHTDYRESIIRNMILERGFKVYNKTLKKNLSVDYQDYLN